MNPADHLYYYGHLPQAESIMEFDQIIILIERVGLPAVIIGACFYYIVKTQQAHRQEIIRWEEKDFEFERKISEDVWGLDLIEKFNEQFKSHLNNGLSSKDAFYQVLAIEPFDEFKADFESIKKNYNVAEDA